MTLPSVGGWLIDFRTARAVFSSGSNSSINHCIEQCAIGRMRICHCEEDDFKSLPALEAAFLVTHDNVVVPDEAIMARCAAVSSAKPSGKRQLAENHTAVFLAAIAGEWGFGVISDHTSTFATVYDLCLYCGVPVLRSNEYFALAC